MSHNGYSTLCSTLCLPQIRPFCLFNGRRTLLLFYLCGPQNCIVVRSEWERVEEWRAQAHVLHTAGRIKKAYQMRTTAAAAGRQRCCLTIMPQGGSWAWSQLHDALWQNIFIERIIFTLEGTARVCVCEHVWRVCVLCVSVLPCGTFCLACALFMPAICLFVW